MPTASYALDEAGPLRLEISWPPSLPIFQLFTIQLDGKEIGTIRGRRAMKRGREFKLPDGSVLEVKQVGDNLWPRLNGTSLLGRNPFKLEQEYAKFCSVIFLIAAFSILIGILSSGQTHYSSL